MAERLVNILKEAKDKYNSLRTVGERGVSLATRAIKILEATKLLVRDFEISFQTSETFKSNMEEVLGRDNCERILEIYQLMKDFLIKVGEYEAK